MRHGVRITWLVAALAANATAGGAGEVGDHEAAAARIERALMPTVVLEGQGVPRWTLAERMEHYRVPGLAVAVIRSGEIAWTRGYGMREAGGSEPVSAQTLFQAASISKPVTAAGALKMVEAGLLGLDNDVNQTLTTWKVPANELTRSQAVTLRRLLSHTAGTTVHGFPGYLAHETVPSVIEVLDGQGNTDPIRVDVEPGRRWRYSGGGYTVAQLLMTDVAGQSFPDLMEQRVLGPAGMGASTFHQPLPRSLRPRAAVGHGAGGGPIEGRWHTYPELAAAGLWTTPGDLARFSIAIWRSNRDEPGGLLSAETAEQMLREHDNDYGLGWGLFGDGAGRWFGHGGSNEGFRCHTRMYIESGDGVVIMANGERGIPLIGELIRAVAAEYRWPGSEPEVKTMARLAPQALGRLAGRYQASEQFVVTVALKGEDRLDITVPGLGTLEMLPESEEKFFSLEPGIPDLVFVFEDGKVVGLRGPNQFARKIE